MSLIFKYLWWKFFGVLELESDEVSIDKSLLKFLETLKFDSNKLNSETWNDDLNEHFLFLKICIIQGLEAWIRKGSLICSLLSF